MAERLYRRALAIKEQLLGPDHPDVALTLNNLAVLCAAQGRYGEAGGFYRRTLAIMAQVHGPMHPAVRACQENYAQLLQAMQREAPAVYRGWQGGKESEGEGQEIADGYGVSAFAAYP